MRLIKSIIGLILILRAPFTQALDLNILSDPPAQSTSSTCQSYSMAAGLSLMFHPAYVIDSEATMKEAETRIRSFLTERCTGSGCSYTRDDWKRAIEKYTSNAYTLRSSSMPNQDSLFQKLYTDLSVKHKSNLSPGILVTLSGPTKAYFLSVKSIAGKAYATSHIVTVLGVDAPNQSIPGHKPSLLVLNSADKNVPDMPYSENQCIPWPQGVKPKYIGSLTWVSNYELYQYQLDSIELNNSTSTPTTTAPPSAPVLNIMMTQAEFNLMVESLNLLARTVDQQRHENSSGIRNQELEEKNQSLIERLNSVSELQQKMLKAESQ